MAENKYFVRTTHGQKGPYTLREMKTSLQRGLLSAETEYRRSDEDDWHPIDHLKKRLARADAKKAEAAERARESDLAANAANGGAPGAGAPRKPAPSSPLLRAIPIILIGFAGVGWMLWTRGERRDALGKPCKVPADCPSGASCMLTMGPDRKIDPEGGYCTIDCSDTGDCASGMYCGQAAEVGPQGAVWDGMLKKQSHVCLKR